ncbi:MAG: hypothetical protein RJA70_3218 [Pseudomonadota bacterium]|jgi:hypothetical protein
MAMPLTLEALGFRLLPYHPHARLGLRLGDRALRVVSNSDRLLNELAARLAPWVAECDTEGPLVEAIQAAEPVLPLDYHSRAPLADYSELAEFCDLADGQVVRTTRSGLHFFVGRETRKVLGNCLANVSQVERFILDNSLERWRSVAETPHEQAIILLSNTNGGAHDHGNRLKR